MALFNILPELIPGDTEENHRKLVKMAEIQTGHLQNTHQKHYHLSQLAQKCGNVHSSGIVRCLSVPAKLSVSKQLCEPKFLLKPIVAQLPV